MTRVGASAPDSVGYEITRKALVFGGDTLTTTDIVVAAGLEDISDRARVKSIPARTIDAALATIHRMVDETVDHMKTSADPLPVVLVGGGSILVSRDLLRLQGDPPRERLGRQCHRRRDRPSRRRDRSRVLA